VNWTVLKTMTGTSLTHSSATGGYTYYYKVMAVSSNSAANSAYSSVGSVTVSDAYALAAPVLSVAPDYNVLGRPKLSWTRVNGATEYKIYWSDNGGNTWYQFHTTTGDWLTHASATVGVTHYYKVVAVSPYDTSEYSNIVSIIPE
jgi:fibronectin type 3 domain-containing protein